jgi:carbon-monoxide dehydrogenase medium subunit
MAIAAFSYHDPTSVPEALELLEKLEDAKPLAGGQSLVPYLFIRTQCHRHLIDLTNIPELSYCSTDDGFAYRRDDPAARTAGIESDCRGLSDPAGRRPRARPSGNAHTRHDRR